MLAGKRWWWISYTDETRAKGDRAVGACVVQAGGGFTYAVDYARESGLQPVGEDIESHGGMMLTSFGDPPPEYVGRWLTNEEATTLAKIWGGGVATPQDVERAFADDDAQEGSPLFRGPR
jgi:hypothetical protein